MKYGRANFQPVIITIESIEEAIALHAALYNVDPSEAEDELRKRGVDVPYEQLHPALYQLEGLEEFLEEVIEGVA